MTDERSGSHEAMLYGNRFLTEDAPAGAFPDEGMPALDAMRLVDEKMVLEGDPWRNRATFVTTWMEPRERQLRANRRREGAVAARRLQADRRAGLRRVRPLLAALGRAPLDAAAYTMPPEAEEVKVLRAPVKQTLSRVQVDRLADDIHTPPPDAGEEGRRSPK